MLKVVTFMKQVAMGLQVEGNFGTAHVLSLIHISEPTRPY